VTTIVTFPAFWSVELMSNSILAVVLDVHSGRKGLMLMQIKADNDFIPMSFLG